MIFTVKYAKKRNRLAGRAVPSPPLVRTPTTARTEWRALPDSNFHFVVSQFHRTHD